MNDHEQRCHCGNHVAIRIRNLNVKIGAVSILEDVSAEVPRGMCTAVVGPNGAGKTTLTRAILDDIPYRGEIEFGAPDGTFSEKKPRFGYVPQKLLFDRDMPLTVTEFLAGTLARRPVFFGISKKFRNLCLDYLTEVECGHLAARSLGALSGGELQRVLLAQALMQNPEILILDEPAAGVDFKGEQLCCELLEKFRRKLGFTQLMISHDLSMVAAHAEHVICINRKVYAEGVPSEVLTSDALSATFGLHMGMVKYDKHGVGCRSCSKQS